MNRWVAGTGLALAVLAGCATTQAPPTASSSPGLTGTTWQLVKFQGGDDTTLTPDDRTKYTLEFSADGGVSTRLDCNRGRGSWTSAGPGQIRFGPLALTRAMCPPGSMDDQIVKNWDSIRSYLIRDGHLFLSLMADAGTYEFEPAAAPAASSSSTASKPGATRSQR